MFKKERISGKVVQTILDRQVNCDADWEKITDIITIGIDEIVKERVPIL